MIEFKSKEKKGKMYSILNFKEMVFEVSRTSWQNYRGIKCVKLRDLPYSLPRPPPKKNTVKYYKLCASQNSKWYKEICYGK